MRQPKPDRVTGALHLLARIGHPREADVVVLQLRLRSPPALVGTATLVLLRLWDGGIVHPVVGATFPLAEASEAHRLIDERRSTGKVVLVP